MDQAKLKRMDEKAARIQREAEEFDNTPEGRELDLRMDFAVNLLKTLKRKKITQAHFCRIINMTEPRVAGSV